MFLLKLIRAQVKTITAANPLHTPDVCSKDSEIAKIDTVAIKTLKNNMLNTFVDAPKRDRRLWLGDFWETTRANYATYNNLQLSKRCLYLFAAATDRRGWTPGTLFIVNNQLVADKVYWVTWSLMFATSLYDYYINSGDLQTLQDLFPTALKQIQNTVALCDNRGILPDFSFPESDSTNNISNFIEWNSKVNSQGATQALLIYTINKALKLAEELHQDTNVAYLKKHLAAQIKSAQQYLWDSQQELFISGNDKQVSAVTQIWFAFAKILPEQANQKLLKKVLSRKIAFSEVMPFNENILLEALLNNGLQNEAIQEMKRYYGYMINKGADTFWEICDFKNPFASPYGSYIINSYCHGWGAYPSYLIREYGLNK